MKKTIIITTILGALISAPAFAKTEGSYVGLDIINTRDKFDSVKTTSGKRKDNLYNVKNKNQTSLGVNYKYAVNFDNFFVAPGVFFDYSNVKAKDADNDKWNLNYRYGAKIDLGYDITDQFAAYVTGGLANNSYKVDWKSVNVKSTGNNISALYGVGIKYSVASNVDLNLGYEKSEVTMKDPARAKTKFDVRVIRLGASYKF